MTDTKPGVFNRIYYWMWPRVKTDPRTDHIVTKRAEGAQNPLHVIAALSKKIGNSTAELEQLNSKIKTLLLYGDKHGALRLMRRKKAVERVLEYSTGQRENLYSQLELKDDAILSKDVILATKSINNEIETSMKDIDFREVEELQNETLEHKSTMDRISNMLSETSINQDLEMEANIALEEFEEEMKKTRWADGIDALPIPRKQYPGYNSQIESKNDNNVGEEKSGRIKSVIQ